MILNKLKLTIFLKNLSFSDAMIGVEKCGLLYMGNKDVAHSGFPEVAFERYAEVLINLVSAYYT